MVHIAEKGRRVHGRCPRHEGRPDPYGSGAGLGRNIGELEARRIRDYALKISGQAGSRYAAPAQRDELEEEEEWRPELSTG